MITSFANEQQNFEFKSSRELLGYIIKYHNRTYVCRSNILEPKILQLLKGCLLSQIQKNCQLQSAYRSQFHFYQTLFKMQIIITHFVLFVPRVISRCEMDALLERHPVSTTIHLLLTKSYFGTLKHQTTFLYAPNPMKFKTLKVCKNGKAEAFRYKLYPSPNMTVLLFQL